MKFKNKPNMNTENVNLEKLSFDEWYAIYEDSINIELAESGADREMDFDSEKEFGKRYEIYLNNAN